MVVISEVRKYIKRAQESFLDSSRGTPRLALGRDGSIFDDRAASSSDCRTAERFDSHVDGTCLCVFKEMH